MAEYLVQIEIEVTASTPEEAARQAWDLLTAPDAFLPTCDVFEQVEPFTGHVQVDLESLEGTATVP